MKKAFPSLFFLAVSLVLYFWTDVPDWVAGAMVVLAAICAISAVVNLSRRSRALKKDAEIQQRRREAQSSGQNRVG
ncbi:MAG: hypothetical protein LBH13_09430 [Cellulomonadaceae bacterium]|jgi:MFS superfamily sulfate permease-like transporter|nr:hypothetical protein [Cellulomonadaceae bacterium]